MDVVDAVHSRSSIRQFLPDPVGDDVLRSLLADASRAASGGNVQPWRIYVVNGESMARLREFLPTQPPIEATEYDIYPPKLTEPYRTNRFAIGEQMYATLGIEREDKAGRLRQFAHNGDFFGAPAALFCFVDRQMGPPQWSDLGMFLQTFMLLAVERGLATCAQEYWSVRQGAVRSFVGAPDNEMLFCGMAIGHADPAAAVNSLRSERMPLDQWARFV
ncbi:MAG: nitroreductase [Acidimicrobiaceae bacterium]|jgi:nitroreductase|nr:nitroreductase [Acidimicrobiaceae bacterium]MBP9052979.1 nitroreductase [Ilumatobacteraceae bacterium]MBK9972061.1 nitroreductase [Acidimicrobiaceae bacterium]HAN35590.1 nitroreductase family protein [Acidimicrobiaceae bacterium]HQY86403.1 nitroreductase [Ilumatobacteraceae bacterium]